MKATVAGVGAIILAVATPAFAHRLDEYLQATTIAVEKDRVRTELRLTPGVDVFPVILAAIDTDRNGVFSEGEQQAYAGRVQRDLSLAVDDHRLRLRLVSSNFPTIQELSQGLGAIGLVFDADVPLGGPERRLVFENRHLSRIGVYLVNGLVPSDPDILAGTQRRNRRQSHYELDYVQAGVALAPPARSTISRGWLGAAALSLLASIALLWRRRAAAASAARARAQMPSRA